MGQDYQYRHRTRKGGCTGLCKIIRAIIGTRLIRQDPNPSAWREPTHGVQLKQKGRFFLFDFSRKKQTVRTAPNPVTS